MAHAIPQPTPPVSAPGRLKLNIGCGFNKIDGYVNVDAFPACAPDVLWDLEVTPWLFEDDAVDEIVAHHVLEHLGQATGTFFAIVKEIYRVVRHGGQVLIAVPHPLHNSFLTDPTHIRAFTPETFLMLSRARNLDWAARRVNVTMLALMLNVDFEPVAINNIYDSHWADKLNKGEVTEAELRDIARSRFGVVREIRARLKVDKSGRGGRGPFPQPGAAGA